MPQIGQPIPYVCLKRVTVYTQEQHLNKTPKRRRLLDISTGNNGKGT